MVLACFSQTPGFGAGVTLITHGLNSDIDDWVIAMARRVTAYPAFPGTNFTCYSIDVTPSGSTFNVAATRIGGSAPASIDSGEIQVKLDWRQLANNNYNTFQVATAVVPRLLQTNFIPELNGHALAELPLHLIGHSRGGSLICEISRLLGTNGLWVDHLTTLDPHPMNNDGFSDFPYTVVDAPARTYENVLFHDNYYQKIDSVFNGEAVTGAFIRRLTSLNGGYSGFGSAHSDVHLWYHGTVDLRVPTDDTVSTITSAERQSWWTSPESSGAVAGFYYSLIGGGARTSTNQPAGSGTSLIRDGLNQRWDFGAGSSGNRTALPSNIGDWPNVLRFNLSGTNYLAYGQTTSVSVIYQWAQPTNLNANLAIFLDDDANPFNGNERLLQQGNATGTTSTNIGSGTISFDVNGGNASIGSHRLFAKMSAGPRVRCLYAPEMIQIVPSLAPPTLDIVRRSNGQIDVGINGVAGQKIALQRTDDFRNWQGVATNSLATTRWVLPLGTPAGNRFFRAELAR